MFERKNHSDPLARKFSVPADIAFEFSSEGEFQQVLPLITDALENNLKLELIYFSPSVEKGVRELAEKNLQLIRALRYPLLTGGFLNWITAKKLVLVRYDLFPEFLFWAGRSGNVLNMVWVTFKKERARNKSISWWKKKFLNSSRRIVYATPQDAGVGKELGLSGEVFDFRVEQITRRLKTKEEKFARIFPEYHSLGLEKYPRAKRLILGNVWPSDLVLVDKLPDDFFILVVPHKLEPNIIRAFEERLGSRATVLNKKGVLCELYADFGKAYVGGGFETSIHSVLEPLISGADQISCGPITYRSTEFDLAKSAGKIEVVRNSQEFSDWLGSPLVQIPGNVKINSEYLIRRKAILSC